VLGTDRAARVPVIVELFTSEGCSSCPGADEELEKLVKSQPIAGANVIGLAFHVDYWNKLGWPDRFSAREFTQRQYEYAKALPTGGRVYTPQMIVDGTSEFVGSDSVKALAGIKDAASKPKSAVDIVVTSIEPSQIKLRLSVPDSAQPTKDQTADALVALTEDDLTSDVNRGENAGRKLHHAAVVRQLKVAASATGPTKFTKDIEITISLDKSWEPRNLKAVAFVQDRGSRQILAAGAVSAQASR
jgi:hypothetical protein